MRDGVALIEDETLGYHLRKPKICALRGEVGLILRRPSVARRQWGGRNSLTLQMATGERMQI